MRIETMVAAAAFAVAACESTKTESSGGDVADVAVSSTHRLTDVDVRTYDLDMSKMRRWIAAMRTLTIVAERDSSVAAAIASTGNETATQSIAKLESNPRARAILRDAGLTPREYVVITSAYLQAALVDAATRTGGGVRPPPATNPRNVEFIRSHRAELDTLVKQVGLGP